MAKLHVGISELRASHVRLIGEANKIEGAPRHLLLFYAVECGLRWAQLRNNNMRTTEKLDQLDHNFDSMIKDLKLSKAAIGDPPSFRLSRSPSERLHHSSAHQAWRYGVRVDDSDERKLVIWLETVCKVVKERL